jgi:glycosyltransferase involved in cell wall biosynthesis
MAYAQIVRESAHRLQLVLAGGEGWAMDSMFAAIADHDVQERVRLTGFLDDRELCALYSSCRAFIYPSLYEGFGLPPLEAMASGTPVVTSNVSSLPEVAGDAAVLVDPYDPHAIADGIYQVLTDEQLRRALRLKGVARAGQFSWEQSVRRVHAIYDEVGA